MNKISRSESGPHVFKISSVNCINENCDLACIQNGCVGRDRLSLYKQQGTFMHACHHDCSLVANDAG